VKAMEVNLSCPNEGHSNMLCFDIERSSEVLKLIKNEIGNTPLIVKISYFHNTQRLGKFVHDVGEIVQGISAIIPCRQKSLMKEVTRHSPEKVE